MTTVGVLRLNCENVFVWTIRHDWKVKWAPLKRGGGAHELYRDERNPALESRADGRAACLKGLQGLESCAANKCSVLLS